MQTSPEGKILAPPFGEKQVLLHSCCAPCSCEVMAAMRDSSIVCTVFFYNPNIHPRVEYEIRKDENIRYAEKLGVPIVDADHDADRWFARVKGLESAPERGTRCTVCFDMRFERTALYAAEHGFRVFTSSLGISRWKDMQQVNAAGERAASRHPGLVYWTHNWRKKGGSERMSAVSKREGFYIQEYCGCVYSLRDANEWRLKLGREKIQIGAKPHRLPDRCGETSAAHLATVSSQPDQNTRLEFLMNHSLFSLKGRVAVVTGGASGLGEAIALGFADAGAAVVATGRRADAVKQTAAALRSKGARTLEFPCDVTRRKDIEALKAAVLREFGRVDVLVNSAGIILHKMALETSEDEWDSVINTNLKGTFVACQVFGQAMVERKSGSIINVTSIAAYVVMPRVMAYGVSKAGVVGLTQYLGCEWAPHGVRVNAIAPGVFVTPLNRSVFEKNPERLQNVQKKTPMGRTGDCREIVGAALYLASDASSFVTAQVLKVDGGFVPAAFVLPKPKVADAK